MKDTGCSPANWAKVRNNQQEAHENPSAFLGKKIFKCLQQYTTVDPKEPGSEALLNTHFTSQSAPDTHRKLQEERWELPLPPPNW